MVLDSHPWSYIAVTGGWLKFWGGFMFLVFTQKLRKISNDQFLTCLCFSRSVVQPSTRQRFTIEIWPLMPGLVVATATTQLESLEDLGSWHVDTSGELLGIPGKDFSCQEKTHTHTHFFNPHLVFVLKNWCVTWYFIYPIGICLL